MAENTDIGDVTLGKPQDIVPEKIVGATIPLIESDYITPNQETEKMEVHHHSHTASEKKNEPFITPDASVPGYPRRIDGSVTQPS